MRNLPSPVSEICAEVLNLQATLLQVDIHPVLECVCLYLYPLLLPPSDVHTLGGVALGGPGGQPGPVGLGHPPVHRHDCGGGGGGCGPVVQWCGHSPVMSPLTLTATLHCLTVALSPSRLSSGLLQVCGLTELAGTGLTGGTTLRSPHSAPPRHNQQHTWATSGALISQPREEYKHWATVTNSSQQSGRWDREETWERGLEETAPW